MRVNGHAHIREHMVGSKISKQELFSYLDLPRTAAKGPVADTISMAVELVKYQAEVAYEISKKQAIALTSTSSTIGVGWSAFFFGIVQESWLTSSIGLMVAVGAMFLLTFWTPKVVDKSRRYLEDLGATKFYEKWLSGSGRDDAPTEGR